MGTGQNSEVYVLLKEVRDTQLKQAETLGEIRGCLPGMNDRIEKLEDHNTREEWKTYGKHGLTALAAILSHKVLKIMGWNI